jgi:flagellar hook-associated protein 3 FlgL
MASIIPVPTSRVGDYFVRQRLIGQVQNDQLDLFKLQNQISTGQRLQLPSDDAPAALRAVNLQRLLDRKGQIQTNVQANNHYLSAAETNLTSVSDLLIRLRAETVGVAGTLSSDAARQTLVQQIDQALETLVATGNAQSQGRYLFSGSRTQVQPYDFSGEFVEYLGNEGVLRSYVDLEQLFETNLAGTDVFGGISSKVLGGDLTPHSSADTLVSTINGGSGISRNAAITVSINTGTETVSSVVDLSGAVTLGDVARLIEAGAPAGTEIVARVTGSGFTLSTPSGTITVSEVAQGKAASELGILTPTGAGPTNTITGNNLNVAVLKTTPLDSLLGTKAHGVIESAGAANNDIVLTAVNNGVEFNDVRIIFVDDITVSAGSETVTYDDSNPLNKTLTVRIQAGYSTAAQVAVAITAEGTFTANVDYHDATAIAQAGTNPVDVGDFGLITSGGSGEVLDTDAGLTIANGENSVTFDTSTIGTVEELLNLINGSGLGVVAEINAAKSGINVRSRLNGADLTIGENGGQMVTQLGLRTTTGESELANFNRGLGVPTTADPTKDDLLITARDGTQLAVNLSTAKTVQDVIDLVNNHPANVGVPQPVTARLAQFGNGIELVDASVGAGSLSVQTVEGSQAAEYLGFVPFGQSQASTNTPDVNGNYVLQSADLNKVESDSVFNTLIRLKVALEQNDTEEIGRSIGRLDTDISRVSFARAEIGSRLQSLEVIGARLEDENVQLRTALSNDIDVDLVEAISNMTARQYALQASLQTASNLLQLSLLDFI